MPELNLAHRGQTEQTLRTLRRDRYRYSPEQVNFIRESYLLDGRDFPWILERLEAKASKNAIWRVAVGRSYPDVPLSPRLAAALAAKSEGAAPVDPEPRPLVPAPAGALMSSEQAAALLAAIEEDEAAGGWS